MKKLILTIILISGIWSTHASENPTKNEKEAKYTYQQALSISLDISVCLMNDSGVKNLTEKSLGRFENETRVRDFVIMALTIGTAQEYGFHIEERFISVEQRKYIKSVVSNCRKVAEFDHRN